MIDITPQYLASQGLSETFLHRFWNKVRKDGPIPIHVPHLGNCWIWTAALQSAGYGEIASLGHGNYILSHIASWIIHYGPIPDCMCVCHKCDNRVCVRPDHLFIGTKGDNLLDMTNKGRRAKGDTHGRRRLNQHQVDEIRSSCLSVITSQRQMGLRFGVSESLISMIVNRKIWKDI